MDKSVKHSTAAMMIDRVRKNLFISLTPPNIFVSDNNTHGGACQCFFDDKSNALTLFWVSGIIEMGNTLNLLSVLLVTETTMHGHFTILNPTGLKISSGKASYSH